MSSIAALCAGRWTVMSRGARAGNGRGEARWTSIACNAKRALGGYHEALVDRTVVVDRPTGLGAAGGALDLFRFRAQSAPAAGQHVFRRGVGRLTQFQG